MLVKIIQSISIKLNQKFGSGYKVYTEPVLQGLDEPCFFIVPLELNEKQVVGKRYFRQHPFDIHYFPSSTDNGKVECLGVAEQLLGELEEVKVYDVVIDEQTEQEVAVEIALIRGRNMKWEVVDGVLHFFVNYDFYITKTADPIDLMGTLEVTSGVKG